MISYRKVVLALISQCTLSLFATDVRQIVLTVEEAQRIVEAWDRLEDQVRSAREDTDSAAIPTCGGSTDLAIIRTCICAIKNQLCIVSQRIGDCSDPIITEISEAACVSQPDINAICASLTSWVKTIVSELRGNQDSCPS